MAELNEEMKKEINSLVGEAVATALPVAFEKLLGDNSSDDGNEGAETLVPYTDPESDIEYAVPAALAKILSKAGGAGKVAGRFVKKHPGAAGGGAAGLLAGSALEKRAASKRKYAIQGYQVDEDTGTIYLDGEAIGEVFTYEDMQAVGMDVPTAVKKPDKLPAVGPTTNPAHKIAEGDVGVDSGNVAAGETAPGSPGSTFVQPLDRGDSEQFTRAELVAQNYDLHQRMDRVETANALITEGRRAKEYEKWLVDQRTAGVPVGDVEKTVDFMMSQTPEQVEAYKKLLLAQPKIAFAKAEQTLNFAQKINTETEEAIKQDYEQNKDTYRALGVSDNDMKYAGFVRTNQAVGEVQPG